MGALIISLQFPGWKQNIWHKNKSVSDWGCTLEIISCHPPCCSVWFLGASLHAGPFVIPTLRCSSHELCGHPLGILHFILSTLIVFHVHRDWDKFLVILLAKAFHPTSSLFIIFSFPWVGFAIFILLTWSLPLLSVSSSATLYMLFCQVTILNYVYFLPVEAYSQTLFHWWIILQIKSQ